MTEPELTDAELARLTPREATVLAMRSGQYDGRKHTLDEIGAAFGLTRERIRQIEKRALAKLGRLGPVRCG